MNGLGRSLAFGLSLLALAGCKQDKGTPPPGPPPPTAKPAACAGGGGQLADAASAPFFPRASGGFCLDPNGGDKAFGDGAPLPIEKICDLFDGECEIYRSFNVRRVTEIRYVDGGGSAATIDVHLSKFGTTEAAYAMFTKRVVGDGDPASDATPRPIEGGGAAALGLGNAYLWRGNFLAEITYSDESAAEPAMKAAGERLLPPLVKDVGARLPGETTAPPGVASLPREGLIPLGVRYWTKDLLGVDGVGGGAVGYYKDGARRWRVVAVQRADAEQAKDALKSFGKLPGAAREKDVLEGAVRFMHKDEGVGVEWVFARMGTTVFGVGDEVRAMTAGTTAEEHARVALSKDEKIARLRKLGGG